MKSYKYLGWKGSSNNEEALNFAISLLPEIPECYIFKKKDNRVIYRFTLANTEYFAKLNQPTSFYHKIKALFFPNSYFEFGSAMLAESSGLPVVKASGWCTKKYQDMIVTENPGKSFVDAGSYWIKICLGDIGKRSLFLSGLALFIRKYIEANLYHRDFHLGNLLLEDKNETISFMLIDPLGIRKKKNSTLFNSGVLRLLVILKRNITTIERVNFLLEAGIIKSELEFKNTWEKIILSLVKHENRKWFGRRSKIFKGHSRYSESEKDKEGKIFFLRESASKEDFENYEKLYLSRTRAKRYWLYSCFLQSHGIDHRMPVVWLRKKNGGDLLLLEKIEKFTSLNESVKLDEFMNFCTASGVRIIEKSTDIILRDGRPCLSGSDPKRFNKNFYFF